MQNLRISQCLLKLFVILLISHSLRAQNNTPVFENVSSRLWADSVFKTLSYEQKIGQLFMVDAYSNRDTIHREYIKSLICDYHIGGLIFFQGGPVRQANLNNYYQSMAEVPLMIGIDGEWGLSMRLDSTIRFPRQMTLGAMGNDTLIYKMAYEIGRQCKRMGIHLNFAPVADINNNPLNPVINSRSFGEIKKEVAEYAIMYMKGLQDQEILACGKHFPGHGNTDTDSHFSLPRITQTAEEMDSVELYPFRELVKERVASMMVAHLYVPALDTTPELASTLSKKIITNLLQEKMGFEGLIFTDALNMKGVADFYPSGDLELKALLAGNDVLLYSSDVPAAWMRLHYAIQNCEIDQEVIDLKVRKILMAKQWAGLNKNQNIDTKNLIDDLNSNGAIALNRNLYEKSITVLKNDQNFLPLKFIDKGKVASVVFNDSLGNPFQLMMQNYADLDLYRCDREVSTQTADSILEILSKYETVIFSIHNTSTKAISGYGVSDRTSEMMNYLNERTKVVSVIFGNAYTLSRLPYSQNSDALILSYEDTGWPQYFTAQAIFGASELNGHLPVTPTANFSEGTGVALNSGLSRLRFADPSELNILTEKLDKIDSLAISAIADSATPGCQILAAKDGKIFYQKSFGNFTYDSTSKKVSNSDLYDIASITKIAATALALMKLQEEGKIDINKKASKYLRDLRKSNKKDLIISDILAHQAGLKSWIPFWKETVKDNKLSEEIFQSVPTEKFNVRITDTLYMLNTYRDSIWNTILESKLEVKQQYVYSDLGMLIMQKLIEEVTDMPLDKYLETNFYNPLGLHRLLFNPAGVIDSSKLVPTENDTSFRKILITGYVHDPAAAMWGGVAGNAGLFSNATSLAVIMQMLLNGGEYGGRRYLSRETISMFTATRYFKEGNNRRGLVFDKPEPDKTKNGPTAASAPISVFGHTGFTGTCAWADPDNELVYIFLSNRIHPDASNNKLARNNYRTDIMEVFYDIIKDLPAPLK